VPRFICVEATADFSSVA